MVLALALLVFDAEARVLLLILGATKVAESLSEFCYGVFQRHDRMRFVAASLMLRSVGGTIVFIVLLAAGVAVETAFLAQFAVWTGVAVLVDHARARRLWRAEDGAEGQDVARMTELAGHAALLAFGGLLSALQGNTPRYVIAWLLGVVALGQFTVVGYVMQAISTVAMAVSQSLTSRFARFIEDRAHATLRRTLAKLMGALALIAAVSILICLVIGDWLVAALFGPDYANLGGLLTVCVLAAFLRAKVLTLQMCLMAARRYRRNLEIRVGTTLLMLLACAIGGYLGGLNGVVWGMCGAFLGHITVLWLAVRPLLSE
jgi:O-antigen/teichoic acid export membrane protein